MIPGPPGPAAGSQPDLTATEPAAARLPGDRASDSDSRSTPGPRPSPGTEAGPVIYWQSESESPGGLRSASLPVSMVSAGAESGRAQAPGRQLELAIPAPGFRWGCRSGNGDSREGRPPVGRLIGVSVSLWPHWRQGATRACGQWPGPVTQ
jgi:hypothetical protein